MSELVLVGRKRLRKQCSLFHWCEISCVPYSAWEIAIWCEKQMAAVDLDLSCREIAEYMQLVFNPER